MDASAVPKNDGAKVYKILEYLCKVPLHKSVTVKDIFQHTGVVRGYSVGRLGVCGSSHGLR